MIFGLHENKNELSFLSLALCAFVILVLVTISGLNLLSILFFEIDVRKFFENTIKILYNCFCLYSNCD